ncbi:hypothetical protein LEP1GSC112_0478 [Leptospira interrogans serovar Pomona str. UT364]|nr:hypothetical protein LEP1GSC112_0478 [Leptospira interrogans serovar Pomona str. UT364]
MCIAATPATIPDAERISSITSGPILCLYQKDVTRSSEALVSYRDNRQSKDLLP